MIELNLMLIIAFYIFIGVQLSNVHKFNVKSERFSNWPCCKQNMFSPCSMFIKGRFCLYKHWNGINKCNQFCVGMKHSIIHLDQEFSISISQSDRHWNQTEKNYTLLPVNLPWPHPQLKSYSWLLCLRRLKRRQNTIKGCNGLNGYISGSRIRSSLRSVHARPVGPTVCSCSFCMKGVT